MRYRLIGQMQSWALNLQNVRNATVYKRIWFVGLFGIFYAVFHHDGVDQARFCEHVR